MIPLNYESIGAELLLEAVHVGPQIHPLACKPGIDGESGTIGDSSGILPSRGILAAFVFRMFVFSIASVFVPRQKCYIYTNIFLEESDRLVDQQAFGGIEVHGISRKPDWVAIECSPVREKQPKACIESSKHQENSSEGSNLTFKIVCFSLVDFCT